MLNDFNYTDERFADKQLLRYRLVGFDLLPLKQKLYIYYLSKAALCGRDITFDQFGQYNLRIRKTLEAIYYSFNGDKDSEDYRAFEVYLKNVWFSSGIHHHYSQIKFQPEFSVHFFADAVLSAPTEILPLREGESRIDLCDELASVIFSPDIQPKRVCKDDGVDLILSSSCNYYDGVTQAEAEKYYADLRATHPGDEIPSFGLNSKLVKEGGEIKEMRWSAEGIYANTIKQIIFWLEKAKSVCENEQQATVINLLIDYYQTGDLRKFDEYSIEWLKEQSGNVDFINGFIEVYGDPIGIKASWEAIVEYIDEEATKRTQKICQNAQWFEDNSPVDPRFRKSKVTGVTANVICAAMLGGDEYPASAIGINLPNADWIRSRYGSKSVTIGNLTEAYNEAAKGSGMREEFVIDDETCKLINKYANYCDDLHTDLHECLGHGSGQILPNVDANSLKSYGSTIEEARADLFGLYYIADKKLVELGLLPDDEAYKSQYYTYLMNGLMTQLVRINLGEQIEEDHMRNRALIAGWVMEHSNGNVALISKGGKTFLRINDYEQLRGLFAELLAEIQRIKSEGDYEAAREIVEKYGVKIDQSLHKEVLDRYNKLDIAPFKGFINPIMKPVVDADGSIIDIELDYFESFTEQMLRYSRDYSFE